MIRVQRIEINFPTWVELPPGWDKTLAALVDQVCEQFERDNPDYTMWPAGHGSKILFREPLEPDFDDSVYAIDVVAREANERELERRDRQRRADHEDHGLGTAEDGPDDSDCPCRGTSKQWECALTGCGFCRVAQGL